MRVSVIAKLGSARVPVKVDVGFGDVITPAAVAATLPPLLDFPPVRIRAYPRETVIAEKCHAVVKLGAGNNRMKDFYDLYILSETRDFGATVLTSAIAATFRRRATELPLDVPVGLTTAFAEDSGKQTQWRAFLKRKGLRLVPSDLKIVITRVAALLLPVLESARGGSEQRPPLWIAGHGWSEQVGAQQEPPAGV